jgi:PncC family amidohydrolase
MNKGNSAEEETIRKAAAELLDQLKARGLKIAFAESMTGGLISGSLARISGASSVLLGSIVCYAKEGKVRLLGVSEELMLDKGAESAEVTKAMAEGISRVFPDAGIVLSITGSASVPVNDYKISSPPGKVFICFGFPEQELFNREWNLNGSREEILNQAILLAFESLVDVLERS